MREISGSGMRDEPPAEFDWVSANADAVVYLAFDPQRGYGVRKGSIMTAEIADRWSPTRDEAIARGILAPRSCAGWRLNEDILVKFPGRCGGDVHGS